MKTRYATLSPYRVWAREVIEKTIADNVHGPVVRLPKEDLRELRRVLHSTVGFSGLSSWQKHILREEFRATLGYTLKRKPKMKCIRGFEARDILPSMLPWAKKHGLILDPEPEPAAASLP